MAPPLTAEDQLEILQIALRAAASNLDGAQESAAELEELLPDPPAADPGRPREQYTRVVNVIPADATESQAIAIFLSAWRASRQTVTGSYDEAGLGALEDKTAVLWELPEDLRDTFADFYGEHYPATRVEFASLAETPDREGSWHAGHPPRPGTYCACLWLGADLAVPVVARWSGTAWLDLLPPDPVLCWRHLEDEDGEEEA
jgi:hypothetical protein